jgi:D-alanyl-D-alanine carboxypeptidase
MEVQYDPVKTSAALCGLAVLVFGIPGVQARPRPARHHRHDTTPRLVWHVETADGTTVASHDADEELNPASVVKVATSLWAIEQLGPDFRFETRVYARGTIDAARGVLSGDLIVQGAGDPDFQPENAFMVAEELNRLGIREVRGALIVNRKFWIGWENGSEGRNRNAQQRALTMAERLRKALDPRRWRGALRRAWSEFAAARGLAAGHPPRVVIVHGVGVDGESDPGEMLLVHRSEPLATALRRFNCFSNNDIERIGAAIGPAEELAGLVAVRCDAPAGTVRLQTTSGLGENRLTPRLIVRLLREFRETCQRHGLGVENVLPVAGCDPGTVSEFFPLLATGPDATSVVAKTGTLTNTDGGIVVLAGFAKTADGELAFCVSAPHAGRRLHLARQREERFVLDLIARHGGPRPRSCAPPLPGPDTGASVIPVLEGHASQAELP